MANYLIQDTTLTSIADKIRTLSGTEETLSPEVMKEKVAEGNENIAAEADLISQIQVALEGKTGSNTATVIKWSEITLLPTSYAIEDTESTTYYIKLPSKNCWVLFNSPFYGIGCYNVTDEKGLYDYILSDFLVIEESDEVYLQFTTTVTSNHYYTIVEIQEV